jgi:exodeoxyribonuclease V alpha subunit
MNLQDLITAPWLGSDASPHRAPFTRLDLAFAQYCHLQQPSDRVAHRWLAALTSHQWGRGHACLDLQHWPPDAADHPLGWATPALQSLPEDLVEALDDLPWVEGDASPLVREGLRLYLRRAWEAEQTIRQHLRARMAQPMEPPEGLWAQLALPEPNGSAPVDALQNQACAHVASHALTLITGGPGTGKTTTVRRLIRLWQATLTRPLRVVLTAPTGKAAARLTQAVSQPMGLPQESPSASWAPAQTLHRWLLTASATPPEGEAPDLVVVDEASMVDLALMARLLQAVPPSSRLVLLGDKDQLASVEAGAVMAQLCAGTWLASHTLHLQKSHRFNAEEGIGAWARAANTGQTSAMATLWEAAPEGCWVDQAVVSRITRRQPHDEATLQTLVQHWQPWQHALQAFHSAQAHVDDTQALALLADFTRLGLLCAVREGPWGVQRFNTRLQNALGFPDQTWFVGRPVMARRNDPHLGIMNGDLGLCLPRRIDGETRLRVAFANASGGVNWQVPSRLDDVDTVFAMTVHQSQGSEFEKVLLIVPNTASPILTRELIYTGMTRARQRLAVWAPEPEVLFHGVSRQVRRSGGLA